MKFEKKKSRRVKLNALSVLIVVCIVLIFCYFLFLLKYATEIASNKNQQHADPTISSSNDNKNNEQIMSISTPSPINLTVAYGEVVYA